MVPRHDSNPQPVNRRSDTLPTAPPRQLSIPLQSNRTCIFTRQRHSRQINTDVIVTYKLCLFSVQMTFLFAHQISSRPVPARILDLALRVAWRQPVVDVARCTSCVPHPLRHWHTPGFTGWLTHAWRDSLMSLITPSLHAYFHSARTTLTWFLNRTRSVWAPLRLWQWFEGLQMKRKQLSLMTKNCNYSYVATRQINPLL